MAKSTKPAFMSKDDAFKLADSIAKRGKVLDSDIQRAAVSAICYSIIHGDVTIGQKLIECFPAGSRKQSLVTYFEVRGNFEFDKKAKNVVYRKNPHAEQDMAVLIPLLAENPWTSAKPEAIESIYEVVEGLERFIKKMENAAQKNPSSVQDAALLPKLRLALSDYRIARAMGEVLGDADSVTVEVDEVPPLRVAA